jgi:hypothetical protein
VFDVYVVGSTEPGSDGLDKLAEAMCSRYGLSLEDLRGRLARGRFRVKANVDRATGDAYIKDLAAIGGRCILEPATAAPGQSIPPPIAVATPRPGSTSTPPAGVYQSGLSAAFSAPDLPAADLGALSSGGGLALASLDGHDAGPHHASSFGPPPEAAPAPVAAKPVAKAAAPAKAPRPRDVPVELDPFRPPEAEADDQRVEIAADEIEHRARKRMSTPPASEAIATPPGGAPVVSAAAPGTPAMRRSSASISPVGSPMGSPTGSQVGSPARQTPQPIAIVRPPGRLGPLGDERVRFVLGVVIAILLGFVPAHVIASIRERAAYHEVDALVTQKQIDATAQEDYDALDAFRARQLEDKRAAHTNIALVALAIWAAAGGAVAYGWFKRIPWDRLDAPA